MVRPTLPSRSLAPIRATDRGRKMASSGRCSKCFQKSCAVCDEDMVRRWCDWLCCDGDILFIIGLSVCLIIICCCGYYCCHLIDPKIYDIKCCFVVLQKIIMIQGLAGGPGLQTVMCHHYQSLMRTLKLKLWAQKAHKVGDGRRRPENIHEWKNPRKSNSNRTS